MVTGGCTWWFAVGVCGWRVVVARWRTSGVERCRCGVVVRPPRGGGAPAYAEGEALPMPILAHPEHGLQGFDFLPTTEADLPK